MEDRRVNITHGGIPGAAVELPSWVLWGLGGADFAGGVALAMHHGDVRKLCLGGAAAGTTKGAVLGPVALVLAPKTCVFLHPLRQGLAMQWQLRRRRRAFGLHRSW